MAENKKKTASKGDGIMGLVVAIGIVTVVGGGAGYLLGSRFSNAKSDATRAASADSEAKGAKAHGGEGKAKDGEAEPAYEVVPVAPIVTNLSKPSGAYVRLEGSVVVEAGYSDVGVLSAKVTEDIITLLRATQLSEIQGTQGLAYLRDDINDRVRIRSDGKAREFLLSSLVVE